MNRPGPLDVYPGPLDPLGVQVPAFQRIPHTATVVHVGPCACPGPSAWAGAGELAVGLTFLCLGVLLLAAGSITAAAAGGALLAAALAAARDGLGQLERAVRVALTDRSGRVGRSGRRLPGPGTS